MTHVENTGTYEHLRTPVHSMEEQDNDNTIENNLDQEASDALLEQSEEVVEDIGTCNQLPTLVNGMEASDELLTEPMTNSPRRKYGRTILLGGIIVVAMIVGSLAVLKGTTYMTAGPLPKNAEELFAAKGAGGQTPILKFLTSRRLAQVGVSSFNATCPVDQPICNPEIAFVTHLQDGLQWLKKTSPEAYDILQEHNFTRGQQDFLLKAISLIRNPEVLKQGQLVYDTVLQNSKAGKKVVHSKVIEALLEYGKKNGTYGLPAMIASSQAPNSMPMYVMVSDSSDTPRRALRWNDDSIKGAVSWRIPHDPKAPEQSKGATAGIYAGFIFAWIFIPFIPLVWLIFLILQRSYVINVPLGIRRSMTGLEGVLMSICVPGIITCAVPFLIYWLDVWLAFGRSPGTMAAAEAKHIPWDFLMLKLPGLRAPDRHLLAADVRMTG